MMREMKHLPLHHQNRHSSCQEERQEAYSTRCIKAALVKRRRKRRPLLVERIRMQEWRALE
jgi:hypothetical protein